MTSSKKIADYSEETVQAAVKAVREQKISFKKASSKYKIPVTTIRRRLNGVPSFRTGTSPTLLPHDKELQLVNWVTEKARNWSCCTKRDLNQAVEIMIKATPEYKAFFKNNKPGEKWFRGFYKRHEKEFEKVLQNAGDKKVSEDGANVLENAVDDRNSKDVGALKETGDVDTNNTNEATKKMIVKGTDKNDVKVLKRKRDEEIGNTNSTAKVLKKTKDKGTNEDAVIGLQKAEQEVDGDVEKSRSSTTPSSFSSVLRQSSILPSLSSVLPRHSSTLGRRTSTVHCPSTSVSNPGNSQPFLSPLRCLDRLLDIAAKSGADKLISMRTTHDLGQESSDLEEQQFCALYKQLTETLSDA